MLSTFGTGQVFLSILYFTLFFIWFWLLITVFADLFSSHELSGWSKALWVVVLIVLPFLGVLIYLIARGHKMHEHAAQAAAEQDAAMRAYIRDVVSETPSSPGTTPPGGQSVGGTSTPST